MPSTRRKSQRLVKEEIEAKSEIGDEEEEEDQDLQSPEIDEMQVDETGNNNGKDKHYAEQLSQLETDKTLLDFLQNMDDYQPIIPDAVLDHYFTKAGFDCPDTRIKRFLALAAQKFISDVAQDSYQYCKIRQQGMSSKDKKAASKKTVLSMEDLSSALSEYGINAKRPEYYT